MRAAFLVSLALALAACDTPRPGVCLVGSDTMVEGGIYSRISSPAQGDTLRVGQSFRFRAEVEAVGNVSEVGVAVVDNDLGARPGSVLFRRVLGRRVGTYVVDEEVVLDSFRAGANRSEVFVVGAGSALVNTACGGVYGGVGGYAIPVTVLD